MSRAHDKATIHAYQEQERRSLAQHRVLIHAFNLCRYAGMLRSLFVVVRKSLISAGDIQSNDAFKCAVLATDALKEHLGGFIAQADPALVDLWSSTESFIRFVRTAHSATEMSDVPSLLYLTSFYIYDYLQKRLLDDTCLYRRIDADESLVAFAKQLISSIDTGAGGNTSVYRELAKFLDSRVPS